MKLTPAAVALLLLTVPPASALARGVPPPPIPTPPGLEQPIDGYDMRTPYQLWRDWIERQKGVAVDGLLAEPEAIAGQLPIGPPFLRFTLHNDFGHYLSGEIRVYCRALGGGRGHARDDCHYRLRRAFVPVEVAGYDADP